MREIVSLQVGTKLRARQHLLRVLDDVRKLTANRNSVNLDELVRATLPPGCAVKVHTANVKKALLMLGYMPSRHRIFMLGGQ